MIRNNLTDSDTASKQDHEMAAWLREQAAFDELRPSLSQDDRYRDKYVAIHERAVVDCDVDKFQLVRRLMKNFPDDIFFVGHASIDEPLVDLPSLEIEQ
ncbi:MAG: hypothetical protein K8T91_09590 [Planctomycetes bacterium]|nr:hypothetical protein [Planctomycetota bacterium]